MRLGARQCADHPGKDQPVRDHTNNQRNSEREEADTRHVLQTHHLDQATSEAGVTNGSDGESDDQSDQKADQHQQVLELAHDEVGRSSIHLPHRRGTQAQLSHPAEPGPQRQEQTNGEHGLALGNCIFDDRVQGVAQLAAGAIGHALRDLVHQLLVTGQHHRHDGEGQHQQREQGQHGEVRDGCGVLIAILIRVALMHAHDVVKPWPLVAVLIDEAELVVSRALHSVFVEVVRVHLGDHCPPSLSRRRTAAASWQKTAARVLFLKRLAAHTVMDKTPLLGGKGVFDALRAGAARRWSNAEGRGNRHSRKPGKWCGRRSRVRGRRLRPAPVPAGRGHSYTRRRWRAAGW